MTARRIVRVEAILVLRAQAHQSLGKWVDAYEVETDDGVTWYVVEHDRGGVYLLHRLEHPSPPIATADAPMELLVGVLTWTEDGFPAEVQSEIGWPR